MSRLCPICDRRTEENMCPHDGYPTIDLERFEESSVADPLIGKILSGKYKLLIKLGSGGMGSVYKGININLKQDVAVKVLKRELSEDLNAVKRFHREALATSKLKHPNTLRIYDFGQEVNGLLFIVMEFLEGRPLLEIIEKEERISPERLIKLMKQVFGSLSEAHGVGIVHRDLKPENIFLLDLVGAKDFVKVLDFGIAKMVAGGATGETALTKAGFLLGTPYYMSPEQAEGKAIDHKTDLYSLGIIAYECLTSEPPFTGDTPLSILMKQKGEQPPPFDSQIKKMMPEGLERLIFSLLEKDSMKRPESAESALSIIEGIEERQKAGEYSKPTVCAIQDVKQEKEEKKDRFEIETIYNFKDIIQSKKYLYYLIPVCSIIFIALLYFFFKSSSDVEKQLIDSHKEAHSTPSMDLSKSITVPEKEKKEETVQKEIYIKSTPDGADVIIDDKIIGKTPLKINVKEKDNPITLKIVKKGFLEEIKTVNPVTDNEIDLILKEIKKEAAIEKKEIKKPLKDKKTPKPKKEGKKVELW